MTKRRTLKSIKESGVLQLDSCSIPQIFIKKNLMLFDKGKETLLL
jgi:hypothetical protein